MKKPIKPLSELLDSVRHIEGFPIGRDEDILALSDPPYYTACPNPYIKDFIEEHGKPYNEETDDYHREPFVGDVSEGKNDPVYNAHSYHTKVPHKAIMKYISHYTDEGDIVFDGFCGTGMTGVAAQMLNRKAILSDLSPIATFIAYNYNNKIDVNEFEREAYRVLHEVEKECGWMYETDHIPRDDEERSVQMDSFNETGTIKGKINFTVWSDVFICPFCGQDIVFYNAAVDKESGSVNKEFPCTHCNAVMKKTDCKRKMHTFFDEAIGENVTQAVQVPVLINYTVKKKRYQKLPDENDLELIEKINKSKIPYWYPVDRMPEGDESRRNDKLGLTHVHHFYTKRNLCVLGCVYNKNIKEKHANILLFESIAGQLTNKLSRYNLGNRGNGPVSGTLYIASLTAETNVVKVAKSKLKNILSALSIIVKTQLVNTVSATNTTLTSNSIDYIFTDPPFGDNIMYSELNYIWECWLKLTTNNKHEAIVNKIQSKTGTEYSQLMTNIFKEYFRVLKPNRWITVEFHNSKSSIWNFIQDGLTKAGFLIANVAILDKKQGSFKQVTSSNATKNDLVISAYKPKTSFSRQFLQMAGEGLEEEFISMHLSHLGAEPSIERTEQMLYSKMLAYYVQRSYTVRYDAATFYKMLRNKFFEEDGYWFNSNQIEAYHEYKQKMKLEGIEEISRGITTLFVSDEKSALIWLHTFLDKPKNFQTIHPAFHKVASISGDLVPDLHQMLDNNFIREGDYYRRPQSEDEKLSVTQKRERELQREFESILLESKSTKKKLKEVRKQALVYGFEQCYKAGKFEDILTVSRRLDRSILENNSDITEFIDIAEMKLEGF